MKTKTSWTNKYYLSISETLTLKQIMQLVECGQPQAQIIRNDALNYCKINNIKTFTRSVPTDAVLTIIHKDIEYYYNKMLLENKEYKFA